MKNILVILIAISLMAINVQGQSLEEQVVESLVTTKNTASTYSGYWTKFATCEINKAYQDYSTIFELIGNGSSTNTFYYGRLIARIKRQNSVPGIPTHYSLILYNSNIGSENVKGVVNGTIIDFYVKINHSYTRFAYRRILKGIGSSLISSLSEQPFVSSLPSGDIIIDCKDGKISSEQLLVSGKVGIGVTTPSEKLEVDGKILAEEVKVQNVPSSDYVFEPDYHLLPISEVESFIKENKHLPDIPSAQEFKENGVGLGEMDDMLLRKVEELTLYLLEQNKKIETLLVENHFQQKEIEKLKKELIQK